VIGVGSEGGLDVGSVRRRGKDFEDIFVFVFVYSQSSIYIIIKLLPNNNIFLRADM